MKAVRLVSMVLVIFATGIFLYQFAQSSNEAAKPTRDDTPATVAQAPRPDAPKIKVTRAAECQWAAKPPVLDGVLDDPCWKDAPPIKHFASYWDKIERAGTTAYLAWDDEAIYYAGVMTDRELKSFGAHRNDSLWDGDVFELFLKPSTERPEYYEFQANPKELVFEVVMPDRGKITGDFQKQPVLGNKAVVKMVGSLDKPGDLDTSWTVEGRIPWTAFSATGGKPKPEAIWSFAICRYDHGPEGTEPVLMSSAPLTKMNFHHYEDYGKLRFVGPK